MAKSPWRVLVEARKDANSRDWLDRIAATLSGEGHHVVRWRGPLSGHVGCSRILWDCDLAVLFNGTTPRYRPVLAHLKRLGASVLFVELGWYPQTGTLQIDPRGINANASWVDEPLPQYRQRPLCVRSEGDLLVLLQCEDDTQITQHSPYFSGMEDFLRHLAVHSALPLRVRAHPRWAPGTAIEQVVAEYGMAWDESPTMTESLRRCRAMACVNSSGAVQALAARLPVLCFGQAIELRGPNKISRAQVSVAEFCRQEGVSATSFYQWRKKLAQPEPSQGDSQQKARAASRTASAMVSGAMEEMFVPVRITGAADTEVMGSHVEATFPHGVTLRLPAEDRELIRLAVETLVQASFAAGGV